MRLSGEWDPDISLGFAYTELVADHKLLLIAIGVI